LTVQIIGKALSDHLLEKLTGLFVFCGFAGSEECAILALNYRSKSEVEGGN
jgi:hypothetical protein